MGAFVDGLKRERRLGRVHDARELPEPPALSLG